MGVNEVQILVIKIVKNVGQNCLCCVKKYPIRLCIVVFLFLLFLFFPLAFIALAYSSPVFGFAFLVHKVLFIGMDRPKAKSVGTKGKRWKELQSRRSFRSKNRVRGPNQYNQSSSMHDPPGVWQNAKETSNEIFDNNLVDKRTLIEENLKEIREVMVESVAGSQALMPADRYIFDEEYRKCGFDIHKDTVQKSLDVCEDKEKKHDHGKKTVRWVEDDEKSIMDLGVSEDERTKRLESLMERRRSRKWSSFQVRRNGTGNISSGQISSLHIPKINPFLAKSSGDPTSSPPGSAPSYVVKSNPFDLPYDPHEEKPILTGDSFQEEFKATNQKEPIFCKHVRFSLGNFLPPETINFGSDFAIKQLSSGKLVTSSVENKEDDDKQPQQDGLIPNDAIGDYHARVEGESLEKVVDAVSIPEEAAEKAVDVVSIPDEAAGTETYTKEEQEEVHHDVSSDQSSSTSSSSEDEPILRPNKEAILHCLSMSRMRVVSAKNNFHRHAESYDCGPSTLFDKSKTDGFFFGGNKRIHYTSTYSVASDMQVEVSEISSPPSTNISSFDDEASIDTEKGKGSVMNSTDQSEMDVHETRLRDIDEKSDQETTEAGFSRWALDREPLESIMMPEKIDEQDAHYFTEKDRRLTQGTSSCSTCKMDNVVPNQETKDQILETKTRSLETKVSNSEMEHQNPISVLQSESSFDQGSSSNFVHEVVNEVHQSVEPLDQSEPAILPPTEKDPSDSLPPTKNDHLQKDQQK
ncbi:uncharacterized protein LOC112512248 [Cynara cardunculus var. scolymus]|uniref:uncharacterized protein LOC112512248 n=1 Tax=Cynara cardunculus var. scolymus TaxID=59895 RepID=UPI000D630B18|nr:uncharacterized protein LOC112512248 [Cynara cardunculus var. scolymus]